jgi:23S rRNA pseudouridine1911/1915/1917 synthase
VTKEYLALVSGVPRPTSGRITLPLARDPRDRRRVVVAPGGSPSETRYHVVAEAAGVAVVRCALVTGRTHQIRVHLSAMRWPVLGDAVYGAPHADMTRQALHSWRVALEHPVSGTALAIEAPLPADIARVLRTWRAAPVSESFPARPWPKGSA